MLVGHKLLLLNSEGSLASATTGALQASATLLRLI